MTVKSSVNLEYDQFDLKIELSDLHKEYADSPGTYLIKQSIFINRENLAPDNSIALTQLAKSCQLSGEFFIVTCNCCGDAGCAGIDDGIRVTHFDDRIIWEVPDPLSYRGLGQEEVIFVSDNRVYKKYIFDPDAYLTAFQKGLATARELLNGNKQPVECTPDGFDASDLLVLNPIVFTQRGAPMGCKIVGRKVLMSKTPGWVTINGIYYRLRELPVPDEIKALDDWSDWEPKKWKNGYLFNNAAAPESERQRRVQELEKYIASIRLH